MDTRQPMRKPRPLTERQCRARVQAALDELAVLGASQHLSAAELRYRLMALNVRSERCSSAGRMLIVGSRPEHLGRQTCPAAIGGRPSLAHIGALNHGSEGGEKNDYPTLFWFETATRARPRPSPEARADQATFRRAALR